MDIICKKCGSINDFRTEKKSNNLTAYCNGCDAYIKNLPYAEPKMYFGKYKDVLIANFNTPEMINYLHWLKNTDIFNKLSKNIQLAINKRLGGK